jgi:hypothetical protein
VKTSVALAVEPPCVGSGVAESVTAGVLGSDAVGAGVLGSGLLGSGLLVPGSGLALDGGAEVGASLPGELLGADASLADKPHPASTDAAAAATASARSGRAEERLTAGR